jgi:hypothetical protein
MTSGACLPSGALGFDAVVGVGHYAPYLRTTLKETIMASVVSSGRDLRLDLFRAVSLWLLFIEELPGSSPGILSARSYGFSDATAIFIFVFGYTAGAVYGDDLRRRGLLLTVMRIFRRAWLVYVAHVFLFVFYVCEISYVARAFDNPAYLDVTRVRALLDQPVMTLLQGLLLNFQITHMEALALYLLLLATFAPMLWLLVRSPAAAVATSAVIYVLARTQGWELAAYPHGTWQFNPFAWQFLFLIGAWFGTGGGGGAMERLLGSRLLTACAAAYLVLAFAFVRIAHIPQLMAYLPTWLIDAVMPVNRTDLDLMLLVHVMAVAAVAVRAVPRDWPALHSPLLRPALLCGQYSLLTFCLGVFLAFAGWSVFIQFSNGPFTLAAVACAGIAVMIGFATVIDWFGETPGGAKSGGTGHPQSCDRRPARSRREGAGVLPDAGRESAAGHRRAG